MFIAYGVVVFVGPQLGARLAQANQGDYTMAFFIVIGMAILGILLQLFYMAKAKKV